MIPINNDLLHEEEVAVILRCEVSTVQEAARSGKLVAIRFGVGWMFPYEDLVKDVTVRARAETESRLRSKAPTAPTAALVFRAAKSSPPVLPNFNPRVDPPEPQKRPFGLIPIGRGHAIFGPQGHTPADYHGRQD